MKQSDMKLKKKDITNTINKNNEYIHALFTQKFLDFVEKHHDKAWN